MQRTAVSWKHARKLNNYLLPETALGNIISMSNATKGCSTVCCACCSLELACRLLATSNRGCWAPVVCSLDCFAFPCFVAASLNIHWNLHRFSYSELACDALVWPNRQRAVKKYPDNQWLLNFAEMLSCFQQNSNLAQLCSLEIWHFSTSDLKLSQLQIATGELRVKSFSTLLELNSYLRL